MNNPRANILVTNNECTVGASGWLQLIAPGEAAPEDCDVTPIDGELRESYEKARAVFKRELSAYVEKVFQPEDLPPYVRCAHVLVEHPPQSAHTLAPTRMTGLHGPSVELALLLLLFEQATGLELRDGVYVTGGLKSDGSVEAVGGTRPKLAERLFPNARTLCVPDFALTLDAPVPEEREGPPRGMLGLRHDKESALTSRQREELGAALRYDWVTYDTVIDTRIDRANRESIVADALRRFCAVDVVVTDRFHGAVFAVLCRRPCVVLPTIDHKLTAGSSWFDGVPCFAMAGSVREVPELVEKCLRAEVRDTPSWSADNFDGLPAQLGLH